MTLQDICTSLETSRKLAEAGFEQENGIAYWSYKEENTYILRHYNREGTLTIRAFTFNELWECLPTQIHDNDEMIIYQLECHKSSVDDSFTLGYNNIAIGEENIFVMFNKYEPQEAAAELLLWCKQNGYLND